MIQSKAIELVKTFAEDEFKNFGLFVSSPYFNREAIQVKFYDILKKNYPEFSGRNFTKEKAFAKLYPGKKYNDGVMRNILSKTLELAENFLAVKAMQNDEFNFNFMLMRELRRRDSGKLFARTEQKAAGILNRQVKNQLYYQRQAELLSEKDNYRKEQKSLLYAANDLRADSARSLTIAFIISILRSYTDIANSNQRAFMFDKDPSMSNLELYIEKEASVFSDILYVRYYLNAFKLARTRDEKYFHELKSIAETSYDKLSDVDKRDIFTILTNYCYYKINNGDLHFRKVQFSLFKENITRGHHKGNRKFLDHIRFFNVVVTGLDAGEHLWVEEFIEKYREELDKPNRENAYYFTTALVNYHKKLYGKALDYASKVRTDDFSYKHQLKSLYLKIYYDMNETEPFYSHVDSYRHFIMNEKHIPSVTRDVIGSYINFTKKLFDIKNKTAERGFDLMKIRKEISGDKSMINKQWLLDRISEIEKTEAAA